MRKIYGRKRPIGRIPGQFGPFAKRTLRAPQYLCHAHQVPSTGGRDCFRPSRGARIVSASALACAPHADGRPGCAGNVSPAGFLHHPVQRLLVMFAGATRPWWVP